MLTRIIIYWSITLVMVVVLNAYVANNTMYESKSGKVDHIYDLIDQMSAEDKLANALVIGNSYVQASFQPSRIDYGSYRYQKLIVNGMPLNDMAGIIKNLPDDHGIRRILAGIPYVYAIPTKAESSFYQKYWETNPIASWWWSLPVVRGRNLAGRILTMDAKCFVRRNPMDCKGTPAVKDDGPVPGREFVATDPEGFARSVKKRLREMRVYTSYVSQAFREKIAFLAQIAGDKNLELFLYTAPIAPDLIKELNPNFLGEFRSAFKAAGVPYADMNTLSGAWDYTYFFDSSHVGVKGGKITTDWLLQEFLHQAAP